MSINVNGNLAYKYKEEAYNGYVRKNTKKKNGIATSEKLFYIFSVIFVVILSSFVISGYAQIAEYNYTIQKLENSIVEINKENEQLEKEIAELNSPDRILNIAQEELGMTMNEEQLIDLIKN